jgi:2-dehydro-3-deoxygalactonokinase
MPPDLSATGELIAVDWGTSRLRAWLLDIDGKPVAEKASDDGIARLKQGEHETVFERLAADWPKVPAIMAGMIGSRQGWREATYLPCPVGAAELSASLLRLETSRGRAMAIVPGVAVNSGEYDVMRGEETQILGLVAERPDFSGTVILPGTHSKWVRLDAGTIQSFQTFMTGELFELLSQKSFLRHSVSGSVEELPSRAGFAAAVRRTAVEGLPFLSGLFPIRARQLLLGSDAAENLATLSGLTIGAEIAAARAAGGIAGEGTIIVGARSLARAYAEALAIAGRGSETLDGNELALKGLVRLARAAGLLPETKG